MAFCTLHRGCSWREHGGVFLSSVLRLQLSFSSHAFSTFFDSTKSIRVTRGPHGSLERSMHRYPGVATSLVASASRRRTSRLAYEVQIQPCDPEQGEVRVRVGNHPLLFTRSPDGIVMVRDHGSRQAAQRRSAKLIPDGIAQQVRAVATRILATEKLPPPRRRKFTLS